MAPGAPAPSVDALGQSLAEREKRPPPEKKGKRPREEEEAEALLEEERRREEAARLSPKVAIFGQKNAVGASLGGGVGSAVGTPAYLAFFVFFKRTKQRVAQ